ncbi:VCBS repeat-containing protein [Membranihabitans marinus]|uniref:VCBS repeat-containing protein n=1 Tax=Membranihabitans marinus TaxID=1227546 RepID=UPI001F1B9B08|nr:VCBS repeat-containing protein [Membranihabitans marinus]
MKHLLKICTWLFLCFVLLPQVSGQSNSLFQALKPRTTGIKFKNTITETKEHNALTYENLYNGGGVAIGDINNDGLDDIYFVSNMESDALYLNTSNLKFKDITKKANLDQSKGWKTGVAMVDINGDDYLDIYVCYSGKNSPELRRNKLYINQGDLTFVESAAEYGLDDDSYSTQAAFFDYDNDGDLDLFLLTTNVNVIKSFEFGKARKEIHPYAGDKLFRNDDGHFTEVTQEAGILSNALGFGLGVSVADINKDGWLDLYVSNDYVEPDYLYINNGDGSFTDRLSEYLLHISHFSMGSDINDYNNDGWPDILTLDMLPEDNKRQKLLYGPENYEVFALQIEEGFYYQNMRNMLHLNNAQGGFSEIGQLAGLSNTDWSWAPLIKDFDNDGWKDVFITNGYFKDYTNRDFLKYKGDYFFQKAIEKETPDTFELVQSMTSTPLHNYIFQNNKDLTFTDRSQSWGIAELGFSNGAAYGDLDNDGDIDLVVNNQNDFASIYENKTSQKKQSPHYISIQLRAKGMNTRGWGSKINIYVGDEILSTEQMPTRGYQSTVSDVVHFGLGENSLIDSISVEWIGGEKSTLYQVMADQIITIHPPEYGSPKTNHGDLTPHHENKITLYQEIQAMIPYQYQATNFNDFKRQPLLTFMLSANGPVLVSEDVNGDGLNDVLVGGGKGQATSLYFQNRLGKFIPSPPNGFDNDADFHDSDIALLDVDNDGDLDLYIASGGYHDYLEDDVRLGDRLYLNNGKGKFELDSIWLVKSLTASAFVRPIDYNNDGKMDLLIGGDIIPGRYPLRYNSRLLENTGLNYVDVSEKINDLNQLSGWIKDALWVDINADGRMDLITAGPFSPISVLIQNREGKLENQTDKYFPKPIYGWWNTVKVDDFDNDGDMDIIAGNLGLNSQLCASLDEPLEMIFKDFDQNGSIDPILTCYNQGRSFPFASRDELQNQIYGLRSHFTSYEQYSEMTIEDIFTPNELSDATSWKIDELRTSYFENVNGKFIERELPIQAQFAPIETIHILDYDADGIDDLILAGNQNAIRLRLGVMDANRGQLFKGLGNSKFKYIPQTESGLQILGDAKSILPINVNGQEHLWFGIYNYGLVYYKRQ